MKCTNCGNEIDDNEVIVWKCNSCKKGFKVTFSQLQQLYRQKHEGNKKIFIGCKECGVSLVDGNENLTWKCSECGNVATRNLDGLVSGESDNKESHIGERGNPAGNILRALAYIVLIIGTIGSLTMIEFDFGLFIAAEFGVAIIFALFYAISEIIFLLEEIRNKL